MATYTPAMLSAPSALTACSMLALALDGFQPAVSYDFATVTALPSSTRAAALNCAALGSLGEPLIITTLSRLVALVPPRAEISALPWVCPTSSLSKPT